MNLQSHETIQFKVSSGEIKTSFLVPTDSSGKLSVVLPGASYSCKQPLLYFAIQVLLKKKFCVLAMDNVYADNPEWAKLPTLESGLKVVEEDSHQWLSKIEERTQMKVHTLLGRSLGTYAIACALQKDLVSPEQVIWQTPSLNDKWNVLKECQVRSLGIIGTADNRYDIAKAYLPLETLVIEGADHGMEIPGEPVRSIEILRQVTLATEEWLK